MILTTHLEVKVNRNTITHFKSLGYKINKTREIITIPIEHLNYGSKYLIHVRCDIGNEEKFIHYKAYYSVTKGLTEKYYCALCAKTKIKKTVFDKYGVENVFQSDEIKGKIKQTSLEKYGTEYASQSDVVKDKMAKTNMLKYGVENAFQSDEIKERIRQTSLEKYGTEYANQSVIVKNKCKKTCIEKYGTEYVLQNKEIRTKIKQTNISNNRQRPDDKISEFEKYSRKVRCLTDKVKPMLLEQWDGYDYYDKEFILNNFTYHYADGRYPNIDHKISIYYGFINNISPSEIADLNNLCVTKKSINVSKHIRTEFEYIEYLKK